MQRQLIQRTFGTLNLEIDGCHVEHGMRIEKIRGNNCRLRKEYLGRKAWKRLLASQKTKEYRNKNCQISFFGGELKIVPFNKFFPHRSWLKTLVYFRFVNAELIGIVINFWGRTQEAYWAFDNFEKLCDKRFSRVYEKDAELRAVSDQTVLDDLLNKGEVRLPGEWRVGGTKLISEMSRTTPYGPTSGHIFWVRENSPFGI